MQNLTELEVENLRHLIGGHATIINKLSSMHRRVQIHN